MERSCIIEHEYDEEDFFEAEQLLQLMKSITDKSEKISQTNGTLVEHERISVQADPKSGSLQEWRNSPTLTTNPFSSGEENDPIQSMTQRFKSQKKNPTPSTVDTDDIKKKEPNSSNSQVCLDQKKIKINPFDSSYEEDQAAIHSEAILDCHLKSKTPENNPDISRKLDLITVIPNAVVKRTKLNPFDSSSEEQFEPQSEEELESTSQIDFYPQSEILSEPQNVSEFEPISEDEQSSSQTSSFLLDHTVNSSSQKSQSTPPAAQHQIITENIDSESVQCTQCAKIVSLQLLNFHIDDECPYKNCFICQQYYPSEFFEQHMNVCLQSSENQANPGNQNQHPRGNCIICHEVYPQAILQEHIESCLERVEGLRRAGNQAHQLNRNANQRQGVNLTQNHNQIYQQNFFGNFQPQRFPNRRTSRDTDNQDEINTGTRPPLFGVSRQLLFGLSHPTSHEDRHARLIRLLDSASQIDHRNIVKMENVAEKTANAEDKEDMCAICYENYQENEKIKIIGCKHKFHGDCIDQWIKSQSSDIRTRRNITCPVCRHKIS